MTRARHLSLVRPDGRRTERGREDADLVREVATVLASTTSFRGALPRTLDVLCDALDARAALARVRRQGSQEADPVPVDGDAAQDAPPEPPWSGLWHPDPPPATFDVLREDEGAGGADPDRSPAAAAALEEREVVRFDDVSDLAAGDWRSRLLEADVRGVLALPVFAGTRPAAVVELYFASPLEAAEPPDEATLSLVLSELERRAGYDRMRSAVRRSARLWRSLNSGRASPRVGSGRADSDAAGTIGPSGAGRESLYEADTGLPSRALFLDRVDHTLARRTRQPDRLFALLVFAIDERGGGIRSAVDSARPPQGNGDRRGGPSAGDEGTSLTEVARTVGRRLRANVRPGDSVGHLSPSRLGVLLEDIANRSDASAVARRLEETVREEEFDLLATTGVELRVGTALARPAHEEAEDVADEALADAATSSGR